MPVKHVHKHYETSRTRRSFLSQPHSANFDVETGLVFTETNVAVRSRQHSDWIGELKTPSLLRRTPRNGRGARSLLDMAKMKTIQEFRGLTTEHFAVIPWSIAHNLWEEILDSHGETFHIWRTLAASYSEPLEFGLPEFRYHLEIKQPSLLLESYLSGITSTNSSWLTALRISPKETRIADLVSLSKVSNLAVLDLSDGQASVDTKSSSFDERVLRAWSEQASSGSFPHLSVFLLGWQEHLDHWLFHYLPYFPDLQQVIITDCPRLHQKNRKDWEPTATLQGWQARHAKRSARSLRPNLNEPKFPLGSVSGLYYTTLAGSSASRPMLECWIGTPKKWTHILDDFPGTRTVYFDRMKKVVPRQIPPLKSCGTSKRSRERNGTPSTSNSPEPKRALKPKSRMKATASSDLDDLLAQYRPK